MVLKSYIAIFEPVVECGAWRGDGISVEGKPKRLRSRPAQQLEHLGSCEQQKNKKRSGNMNKTSGKQELIVWSSA